MPNEPIRLEDIDLLWDHPEKRVGRSQDILNMIAREMGGDLPPEEQEA